MANERRKRKFINSWAQGTIAVEIVLHALLFTAMISLILFSPPFVSMFSQYPIEDHQAVAKDLYVMNIGKWPLFLLLAVFIGITSILFSHHIVGPAYQFQRALNELNDRNLDVSIKLRKWDYHREVQDGLNLLSRRLRTDFGVLIEEQKKALSLCHEISDKAKATELEKSLVAMGDLLRSYRGISS